MNVLRFFETVIVTVLCSALCPWQIHAEISSVRGVCEPNPPCYCNEECFRCGPGGCPTPGESLEDKEKRQKEFREKLKEKMDEGLRSKEELEKKQEGGRNRLKDMIDDREMQGETRNYLKEELDNQENQEEVRESLKKELDNPLFRDVSEAYQEKRKFAETLFASKEHFRARCAVVLSAALDLRPDPKLKEKSLADIDTNIIEPAFRGTEVLERFYVQAQQLADRLARDWHQMKRYDDWHTARAKLGGHKGVIFFRDADFRLSTLRLSGDHIDVWDGALTGSGYSFSRAKEIWFWELPN